MFTFLGTEICIPVVLAPKFEVKNFSIIFSWNLWGTVSKKKKFFHTKKIFLEINFLVIPFVKTLLSWNFCQKSARVNFCNFYTVIFLSMRNDSEGQRHTWKHFFFQIHVKIHRGESNFSLKCRRNFANSWLTQYSRLHFTLKFT